MKEPFASRFLFPLVERDFTYRSYDAWLDGLRVPVVPLRELAATAEPVLAIRHDVDDRLESALELARLEHARGIRATYFVLHTAPYYRTGDPGLLAALLELQDELAHEVGWHNDLLTLERVHRIDAARYLEQQLAWLRGGGLRITGASAHGSPWCHRLGYHNNYLFRGWDEPVSGFPATHVPQKLDPEVFGLEYEAYHLPYDTYFSDSRFESARRAHPRAAVLGRRSVALVHPCHWDRSAAAKAARLARKVARHRPSARSRAGS